MNTSGCPRQVETKKIAPKVPVQKLGPTFLTKTRPFNRSNYSVIFRTIYMKKNELINNDSMCGADRESMQFIAGEIHSHMNNTIEYIKDKENKKLLIFRYSFAALPILGGILTLLFAVIQELLLNPRSPTTSIFTLNIIFIFIASLILMMTITIIKYLIAIKGEIVLATRQINCSRQALLDTWKCIIDTTTTNGVNENLYEKLIGRHNKYPLNNDGFRKHYQEKSDSRVLKILNRLINGKDECRFNENSWYCRAVRGAKYRNIFTRSSDLSAIISLGVVAIGISFLPLMGNIYLYLVIPNKSNGDILLASFFALLNIVIALYFLNIVCRSLFLCIERIDKAFRPGDH